MEMVTSKSRNSTILNFAVLIILYINLNSKFPNNGLQYPHAPFLKADMAIRNKKCHVGHFSIASTFLCVQYVLYHSSLSPLSTMEPHYTARHDIHCYKHTYKGLYPTYLWKFLAYLIAEMPRKT